MELLFYGVRLQKEKKKAQDPDHEIIRRNPHRLKVTGEKDSLQCDSESSTMWLGRTCRHDVGGYRHSCSLSLLLQLLFHHTFRFQDWGQPAGHALEDAETAWMATDCTMAATSLASHFFAQDCVISFDVCNDDHT